MSQFFNIAAASSFRKAHTILPEPPISTGQVSNISTPVMIPHATFGSTTYWIRTHKTSDWPLFTGIEAPYFNTWSTDHVSGPEGKILWGEMDAPDYSGFTGIKGVIRQSRQIETQYLKQIPTSISGLSSDTYFLYCHTQSEPGNTIPQETRLITTSGGNLPHLCTWNDRGRPLGVFNDDVHTGYAQVFGEGPFIADHLTVGGANFKTYISESTDGLTFTRKLRTDTLRLPNGNDWYKNTLAEFKRNGVQYAFCIEMTPTERYIALVKLDADFIPSEYVQRLTGALDLRTLTHYDDGNTAWIYFSGGSNILNNEPNYFITCDLTTL